MVKASKIVWLRTDDGIQSEIDNKALEGYELISIVADQWQEFKDHEDGTIHKDAVAYLLHFKETVERETMEK